jgi:3-hydroxyisobutyrate dehydrogenase
MPDDRIFFTGNLFGPKQEMPKEVLSEMSKFGFIGLGDQGAPIARRMIDAGLPVALWARRVETLEPFSETPAELIADITEFANAVEYIGICVVDDNGVQSVCEQVIPKLRASSTIVIHSTISPELCEKLAGQAENYGLNLIDAPVSGGSPAAQVGTLTVMVGGDEKVLEKVRPVFETFASLIVHLGDVGAGQRAKLINNSMLAAHIGLAHYGLEAAQALSLDRDSFVELINASSGRSFGFEVCARITHPSAFEHGASLLSKDVALLGSTLGEHASFTTIQNASKEFLELALQPECTELSE